MKKKSTKKARGVIHKRISHNSKLKHPSPEPKEMFTVSSVSSKPDRRSRCWSFWDTLEDAIECGVKGWSDAEFFYESGHYDWIVIEKIMRNHPLPITISERVWFEFVPGPTEQDKVGTKQCECPKQFERVVGFH